MMLIGSLFVQIALQSWFQRNYTSVVAMFEDRFELWTIERLSSSEGATQTRFQQLRKNDPVDELKLKRLELPARRGKELRALTGWYLFLLSEPFKFDVSEHFVIPLVRTNQK